MKYHNFNDQDLAISRMRDRMTHSGECTCYIYERISACLKRAKSTKTREILTIMLGYVSSSCRCYE